MDTNNNITTYNIKCLNHPDYNIIYLCSTCNNEPICSKCIVSKEHHRSHTVDEINMESIQPIIKEFKEKTIDEIKEYVSNDLEQVLTQSNNHLKILEEQHLENLNLIETKFKKFSIIFSNIEKDLKRQIITKFDENKETYNNNKLEIEFKKELVREILEIHEKNNEVEIIGDIDLNKSIEILKHNNQLKRIINQGIIYSKYKDYSFELNEGVEDLIKECVKNVFIIKVKPEYPILIEKKLEITIWDGLEFIIYKNGYRIPEGTKHVAIGTGQKLPDILPDSVKYLLLPDGFNDSWKFEHSNVSSIFFYNIKVDIKEFRIPDSVGHICFGDGFSQEIHHSIFPNSVRSLYLCDILHPLNSNSIPPTVNAIEVTPSFKHNAIGILPSKTTFLLGREVKKYNY